jgi:hypothetical protein
MKHVKNATEMENVLHAKITIIIPLVALFFVQTVLKVNAI